MPIVVQGYTIRYRTLSAPLVKQAYERLAAMGYDGVEQGLGSRYMSPEEDAAMLAAHGLASAASHCDVNDPDASMKRAQVYGVNILGLPAIPGEMLNSVEGFEAYAAQINAWAAAYKGTGFKLQYHHHAQEFRNFPHLSGKPGLAILLEQTDPEAVIFELDTHWMAAAGCDSAQWIKKLAGRIQILHVKDYAIDWKAQDTGMEAVHKRYAEIGQGNINWPSVIAAGASAGVRWYSVEQDRTALDEFESLKISVDYLRSVGAK